MPCYSIAPAYRRNVHFNPFFGPQAVSVFPRFSAPFFRNLEDDFAQFDNFLKEVDQQVAAAKKKSFQPRFDVKEESDKFVLHGELPGVQPENLQIEFVDKNTMVIKGKVVRQESHGTPPTAPAVEEQQTQEKSEDVAMSESLSDTQSETTSNYHKASVEDEDAENSESTKTTPAAEEQLTKTAPQEVAKPAEKPEPQSTYWVSERIVGEFSRYFKFPGRVNQDEVKAALKDGVLTVSVPKLAEEDHRRKIEVQGA